MGVKNQSLLTIYIVSKEIACGKWNNEGAYSLSYFIELTI